MLCLLNKLIWLPLLPDIRKVTMQSIVCRCRAIRRTGTLLNNISYCARSRRRRRNVGEEDKIGTHDMGDYLHLISVGKVGDEGDTQWGEDKVGEHNQCHLQVVLWVVVE